jgi:hypothetical protein
MIKSVRPLTDIENDLVECATKYALGANDYYVFPVTEYLLQDGARLSVSARRTITKEIRNAVLNGRGVNYLERWDRVLQKIAIH